MSEYVPTTEHVRDAYVRAMRNAFIASAGEHEAEFDRWLEQVRNDERERLIATVEALHRPRTIQVLTGDCAAEECEHEELADCPLTPFEQCVECDRIAEPLGTFPRVGLDHGCIECRNEFGGKILLILAPGQWDSVQWVQEANERSAE